MVKQTANIITGFRIVGSIFLLPLSVFTLEFYIVYLLCGLSDMIDGTIARKTDSVSELGSKLDTIADPTLDLDCCNRNHKSQQYCKRIYLHETVNRHTYDT